MLTGNSDNDADHDADKAIEEQAETWLLRMRSGSATRADAQAFQRWCAQDPRHARAVEEWRRVWGTLGSAARAPGEDPWAMGRAWAARAERSHRFRPGRRAFVAGGGAMAAAAAWLAFVPPLELWPSLTDLAADFRTGTGEQRQFAVADGVVVDLNTQTRIDVLHGDVAGRGIDLRAGEAEIVAGVANGTSLHAGSSPFTVVAASGRVHALAARFNVRRTGNQVCVSCVDGMLDVEHPTRRVKLMAAQQVVYDDRGVRPISSVDLANVTAWRKGLLVFDDVPLAEVVDEINRYRTGKLILRNSQLGESRVHAQFSIHRLDDAILTIRDLYGAHVTELPGNIVLLS
jgi:transmembrane sensor